MMNEVTSHRLNLDIHLVQVAGRTLLRIDVQELPSDSKGSWMLDTKDTWVRRGQPTSDRTRIWFAMNILENRPALGFLVSDNQAMRLNKVEKRICNH